MKLTLKDFLDRVGVLEWVNIYEKQEFGEILREAERTVTLQYKAEHDETFANREVLLIRPALTKGRYYYDDEEPDDADDVSDVDTEELSESVLEVVVE